MCVCVCVYTTATGEVKSIVRTNCVCASTTKVSGYEGNQRNAYCIQVINRRRQ